MTKLTHAGVEYETKASIDGCKGCAFNNGKGSCTKPVGLGEESCYSIIWEKIKHRSDKIDINQEGYKLDDNKLQYSLIPPFALESIARNLTAGLSKYPPNNWEKVENAEKRYLDALYRHLEAHRKGELYDTDSSVPDMLHLSAVAVNAMFLIEFILNPKLKETKCP